MFYPLSTTTCMTDVALHRLTYSRRYGFPLYRAPRTEDGQLVSAGLLTCGSGVFSDLPDDLNGEIISGYSERTRRLQLRGQSRHRRMKRLTVFPFSPLARRIEKAEPSRRHYAHSCAG